LDYGKHARMTNDVIAADPCAIVELRQYTHNPGLREDLIALFEEKFVEGQTATGMTVIGSFRDASDPDRFIWLRGFPNMEARAASLQAFYGGPLWKANRDAANATLLDNDDVLLLHPAWAGSGFAPDDSRGGLITAIVYPVGASGVRAFLEFFDRTLRPALVDAGSTVLAAFATEHSENTFPNLPVREGEDVFVWFARFVDRGAFERYIGAVEAADHKLKPLEILTLTPTAASKVQ
jgi:NIPSNAP